MVPADLAQAPWGVPWVDPCQALDRGPGALEALGDPPVDLGVQERVDPGARWGALVGQEVKVAPALAPDRVARVALEARADPVDQAAPAVRGPPCLELVQRPLPD